MTIPDNNNIEYMRTVSAVCGQDDLACLDVTSPFGILITLQQRQSLRVENN